jgi:4-oxalocrotonate tautomerase
MPLITVEMIEGRTTEQKETFMRLLTEAAITALGSPPETVRVILHENSPNNWSVAGVPKSKR